MPRDKDRDSGFVGDLSPQRSPRFQPALEAIPQGHIPVLSSRRTPLVIDMAENQDQVAAGDQRAIAKTEVSIPKYSGHPKDTAFKTATGLRTEVWEVRKWLDRCNHVKGAARWSDEVTLQQAILCLIPGSPADDWFQCETGSDSVSTWSDFQLSIIKEFDPPVAASERIRILRIFRQGGKEISTQYRNRIRLGMRKFTRNIEEYATPRVNLQNNQQ